MGRLSLPRSVLLIRACQLSIFVASGVLAFVLRFDLAIPREHLRQLAYAIAVWAFVKSVTFHLLGMGQGSWRFVSIPDLWRILASNATGTALSAAVIYGFGPPGFPRSICILDFAICLLLTAGVRAAVRVVLEAKHRVAGPEGERTLIYGAGAAGVVLVRECRANPRLGYSIAGFIDDEAANVGMFIQGVRVLGTGADLPAIARKCGATQILIATPSASGAQMTRILEHCQAAGLRFRTIPAVSEVIRNRGLAHQIRDVAVEDLLGRTPVRLDEAGIRAKLHGRSVLVTGAAGSIGSELCRQIARFSPREIVAYDIAETGLFYLEREMRELFPDVPLRAEIGSIQRTARLAEILLRYRPSVIYHAAAYKHVPLMEQHIFEAVENNVLGTYNTARAAAAHGVEDFVMISSDKAVHPTSVMGVTKRVAELIINSLQDGGTNFVSVRFGNVLGSNGSVVPVFKKQIAAGGPVTVTHPEMRRYFMTIPEAVQLVLQASTMGKGGEIFVLDMGQPVRIVDLARNLILLSGLQPDRDIKVEFTSVRPGEKLYEELSTLEENTQPTYHEKVRIFAGNGVPEGGMARHIEALRQLCAARDAKELLLELKEIVPDYNASGRILRRLLAEEVARPQNGDERARIKITLS